MQAERDTVSQKAVEFMASYLGQIYDGRISGFNQSGLYVQLENTVEGFIPFRTMDEYIEFDREQMMAIGTTSDERFFPGDEVRVQVARADVVLRQIDFELVSHKTGHHPVRSASKSRRAGAGTARSSVKGASQQKQIVKQAKEKGKGKGKGKSKGKKKNGQRSR
jgi:DNA-directed RNA polymerase subunit E'/Rpb7